MRYKIKNAGKGKLSEKAARKIRYLWVSKLRYSKAYKFCYWSYWHSVLWGKSNSLRDEKTYFTAKPNPGAGIGHQMANWIAGYWFALYFGLRFAHIPFSSEKWEQFLGFYQKEPTVKMLKKEGYAVVRLQAFDEDNPDEIKRIKDIIESYRGKKVVFLAEQDQFYHDQFGIIETIQQKFFSAPSREQDKLIYQKDHFNIAIHVRRGDIMENIKDAPENIAMRFQDNQYFVQALKTVLEYFKDKKNVHIYLFSQGEESQFSEFSQFPNLHFCLDMSAQDSFLHMVYADALITSKSSFSYKPALLNKGTKFCPAIFWHGYPDTTDWILLNEQGDML